MHQCHPIPPMFIASSGTCEKATQWQRALQLLHLARQSKDAANVVTIAAVTWCCTVVACCGFRGPTVTMNWGAGEHLLAIIVWYHNLQQRHTFRRVECTPVMWWLHNIKIGCRNYHETQCCVWNATLAIAVFATGIGRGGFNTNNSGVFEAIPTLVGKRLLVGALGNIKHPLIIGKHFN